MKGRGHSSIKVSTAGTRRDAVTTSARELFQKKGYQATTIDQVARNAGYSKRTVYLEFPNKDDLFLSIASDGLEIIIGELEKIPGEDTPLEDYILSYIAVIANFAKTHGDYFRLLAFDVTPKVIENSSEAQRDRARGIEYRGVKLIADQIDNAIKQRLIPPTDSWEAAEVIIGAIVGVLVLAMGGSQTILNHERLKAKVLKAGTLLYRGLLK